MSLLQSLPFKDYQKALTFTLEHCEILSRIADLRITFKDSKKPGELLLKHLDRCGYSVQEYKDFIRTSQNVKPIVTYYKPNVKVAILMANDKYESLSKLATPSVDCDTLAVYLNNMGFVTIIIRNTKSSQMQDILAKIVEAIPENSYCFVFYAGHGCELCKTKCILNIDCPTENINLTHCVTENFLLRELAKCKPDLCVLIMDMCRVDLDRKSNPQIYSEIPYIDDYTIHNNLLMVYTTQASQAAYEVLQIFTYSDINIDVTYEMKTGDTDRIVPGASQYVKAFCDRIEENIDVSALLDKVHGDVENSIRKQRPIKVQCGVAKRSLYDPTKGDVTSLINKLKEISKEYSDYCVVR